MMKLGIIMAALLLSPASAHGAGDSVVQFSGKYAYTTASMDLPSNANASYSGSDFGADVVAKYTNNNYGIALTGGYFSRSLDNTAATSSSKEDLEGSGFSIGTRFYGANLFLGLGLQYTTFTINYLNSGAVTKLKYKGLGVLMETGIDINLGKTFLFTPKLQYGITNADQESSSNTQKLNSFSTSASLGFRF